ncbi:hypothetical protein D3C85_747260 [compost metagenome]
MSLSDCIHCWDTPCTCGHEYQSWPIKKLEEHIAMLQGVLAKKTGLKPSVAYPEGEYDVKLQHSAQIRSQLLKMILERCDSRMVELCQAEIVGSGSLTFIRDCKEPGYSWLQVNSAIEYRLPTADLPVLNVVLGDRIVIFRHHKMLYVVKAPVNLEVKKLPMAIAEATHTPVPYKH